MRDLGATRPSALRNRRSDVPQPRGWAPVLELQQLTPLSPSRSRSDFRRPRPPSSGSLPFELRWPKPPSLLHVRRQGSRGRSRIPPSAGVGASATEVASARQQASGRQRQSPRRSVGKPEASEAEAASARRRASGRQRPEPRQPVGVRPGRLRPKPRASWCNQTCFEVPLRQVGCEGRNPRPAPPRHSFASWQAAWLRAGASRPPLPPPSGPEGPPDFE